MLFHNLYTYTHPTLNSSLFMIYGIPGEVSLDTVDRLSKWDISLLLTAAEKTDGNDNEGKRNDDVLYNRVSNKVGSGSWLGRCGIRNWSASCWCWPEIKIKRPLFGNSSYTCVENCRFIETRVRLHMTWKCHPTMTIQQMRRRSSVVM